ncbi:UNVERIFIED_CONTAM: hypothetical protein Sradi_4815600 [Sesamum radiatum]|uniref:Uncharacterized protein n=1 Tax=Sesamum radiatum TaxID=300843 RepID=A0AAW2MXS0_SESRA
MDLLSTNCCLRIKYRNPHFHAASLSQFLGVDREICGYSSSTNFSTKLCCGYGGRVKALAGQNQTKRSRKRGKFQKTDKDLPQRVQTQDEYDGVDTALISGADYVEDGDMMPSSGTSDVQSTSVIVPSRTAVLQACTVTSGLIGAVGVLIRQVNVVRLVQKIFELLCSLM